MLPTRGQRSVAGSLMGSMKPRQAVAREAGRIRCEFLRHRWGPGATITADTIRFPIYETVVDLPQRNTVMDFTVPETTGH